MLGIKATILYILRWNKDTGLGRACIYSHFMFVVGMIIALRTIPCSYLTQTYLLLHDRPTSSKVRLITDTSSQAGIGLF